MLLPNILLFFLPLLSFRFFSIHSSVSASPSASACHSCLANCKLSADGKVAEPEQCECTAQSGMNATTCRGQHCFAKMEMFPDESVAIVQKGCVDGLPAGIDGCNYSGQTESVHCYCSGEYCNDRVKLNNFVPAKLPVVECCECSQPGGDEQCPMETCLRSCRGNYCLVDFDGVDQGCGHGLPRLQNFLRIPNYLSTFQGGIACAHYQASEETAVNGCVCTEPTGMCNQRNRTMHHQMERVLARRANDLNYCYTLSKRAENGPFGADVYRKSTTCEGHYCFLSMSTRELVVEPDSASIDAEVAKFVGTSKQKYELLAGCLKADDDKKVSMGCTVEFSQSAEEPLSVHCICDTHLCNYFDLLASATNGTLPMAQSPEEGSSALVNRDDAIHEPNGALSRWKMALCSSVTALLMICVQFVYQI